MIRFFLLLLPFALFTAPIEPSVFKKRIELAKAGDYIVTEANKIITILALKAKTCRTVVFEEISVPSHFIKKRPISWADWVKGGAQGHSSWSMIEIDLQSGQLLECYSFSRGAWVQISSRDSLLATLFTLPLKPIPDPERKKIGAPPLEGETDHRKVWQPPLVFEGKAVKEAEFDAFEAIWPEDGTELAGQLLTLFFDRTLKSPFPYWFQIETAHAHLALSVLDTGKNLPSPHKNIPRRVPEFLGLPQKTEKGLSFNLKTPPYYRTFELFAIDITAQEKQIFPVPHSLIHHSGEAYTVEVEMKVLKTTLQNEHRYTWLLVPEGYTEFYTEISTPLLWIENEKN